MKRDSSDITTLLRSWRNGDQEALAALTPIVYGQLRRLAGWTVRGEAAGQSLNPTALVHEAYLRLLDLNRVEWQDRGHFFALAARLMRRILVDAARARRAHKRGGHGPAADGEALVDLDALPTPSSTRPRAICDLDDALVSLAAIDPRRASVIDMRFFAGLSVAETAEALGVSEQTVMRDWRLARAWLSRALQRQKQEL